MAEAASPAREVQDDPQSFLDRLRDPDPQIRLNAAVRLAYLGRAEGLDELLEGLAHESSSIRIYQVPDALALLGDAGAAQLRQLVGQPGPARLGAARTLLLRGQLDGVPGAVTALLGETDQATRWSAAVLAGEVGPVAEEAADSLRRALRVGGPEIAIAVQALVAVAGSGALPTLREELEHQTEARRVAAMRGLAALGTAAADMAGRLSEAIADASLSLGERLTAAQTLVRVSPSGDETLASLLGVLQRADRWLTIGLLRTITLLAPEYPLRPETSDRWPAWESRLILRAPAAKPAGLSELLLRSMVELLEHADHDVRRAAALGLAFFGRAGGAAADAVRAARLPEPLRHDVLRHLGVRSVLEPAGFPWDQAMVQPAHDLDAIARDCESLWACADGGPLDYRIAAPKWAFLHYLVERRGLLLHGSRTAGLDVLRPVSRSGGGTRISDQPGVFAVDHALMAMYFGIVDRSKVPNLSNSLVELAGPDGTTVHGFRLGTDFVALAGRPFVNATVYVLPPDTFSKDGEWTSLVPVRPSASLAITPEDFPLLEYLWGTDLGPLASQFTDEHPALQDVTFWATKRSALSAAL